MKRLHYLAILFSLIFPTMVLTALVMLESWLETTETEL
jgi:thiosulfate reductase cytochrome b subunit